MRRDLAIAILTLILGSTAAPTAAQCLETTLQASDAGPGDGFGSALSAHGNLAVIGAPSDGAGFTFLGAAYVFRLEPRGWIEETKLLASDAHPDDFFGSAVDVDDNRILIGAPSSLNNGEGATYCFRHDGAGWIEDPIPSPPGLNLGDRYGHAVALQGPWAIAGAYANDGNGSQAGAVHVLHDQGRGFGFHSTLLAQDGGAGDQFGFDVALDAPFLVIGAWGHDGQSTDDGAVYVHRLEGNTWMFDAVLTAADGASFDEFGRAVAIAGDFILVGARRGGSPGNESGSAYVFRRSGERWVEEAELIPRAANAGDRFGEAVSLRGTMAVVGAPYVQGHGAISVFDRVSESWSERITLMGPNGAPGDRFGQTVHAWDNRIFVGAPGTDRAGDGSGSAPLLVGLDHIDCNGNRVADACDIAQGQSADADGDGVPDECRCAGDTNGDGTVDVVDLVLVVQQWGTCSATPCPDVNGDGAVNVADLALVLLHWGPCG